MPCSRRSPGRPSTPRAARPRVLRRTRLRPFLRAHAHEPALVLPGLRQPRPCRPARRPVASGSMPLARYEAQGDVGEIVRATPPLNLFNATLIEELGGAVDAAAAAS